MPNRKTRNKIFIQFGATQILGAWHDSVVFRSSSQECFTTDPLNPATYR